MNLALREGEGERRQMPEQNEDDAVTDLSRAITTLGERDHDREQSQTKRETFKNIIQPVQTDELRFNCKHDKSFSLLSSKGNCPGGRP